jgi:hypothetical protein
MFLVFEASGPDKTTMRGCPLVEPGMEKDWGLR